MRRRGYRWARRLGAALVLGVLVQRLGTGPFLDGLRAVGPGALLAALAIGGLTTLCSAWRWRVVAGALGVGLRLPAATAAYYRSEFLNSWLPGGVAGDVHRGLRHGADVGDVGRGVRAVVWERVAGQVIQCSAALVVLVTLPSPVHEPALLAAAAAALAGAILLLAVRRPLRQGRGRLARGGRRAVAEVRDAFLQPRTWPAVLLASLLVTAGHVTLFLIAVRIVGVHGPLEVTVPVTLIVLLAASLPLTVGGWGPREGVAAWVFAATGWGATVGAAAATAFGVMALVATLPGSVVILLGWLHQGSTGSGSEPHALPVATVPQGGPREDGGADG